MSIDYSFSVYSIMPKAQCGAAKLGHFQNADGIKDSVDCEKIALFHNPKTVAALQACCPRVIEAFKNAGFGCSVLDNVAEAKRFPVTELNAHTEFLDRLNTSLEEVFSKKERLVQKLLQSPINRPATMLDRLSGIVPCTNFIVSDFLKSAHATHKSTSTHNFSAKASGNSWASNFFSMVLSH